MCLENGRVRVFATPGTSGALCIAFALGGLACTTTTLDPSVVIGTGEGGADGGSELTVCELFTSISREYLMCPDRLSHEAATADCERRDATLVAVESADEDALIATSSESVVMGDWWLGGSRNDALVWSWPDGTVFWRGGPNGAAENSAYVHWKPGEPNNASTTSPNPERCLALTPADDWNDRACELRLPYICERPP